MEQYSINQIRKSTFLDDFGGYWLLVGENERGLVFKKAFDRMRDLHLYSKRDGRYFRYKYVTSEEFIPATEEDAEFINEYFAKYPDDLQAFHHSTQLYASYRASLLSAGFSEAPYAYGGRFYRTNTEQTAFIINLIDEGYGITAVYGFTLNSFMGDSEYFLKYGEDSERCKLRESVFLIPEDENLQAKNTIATFYKTYCTLGKDELLAVAKEKQKAFLKRFAVRLKPLGFKKKGTKWTKILPSRYQITFHAQKSAYSDEYYFRFYVDPPEESGIKVSPTDSYSQISVNENGIFNWQLLSDTHIESLLNIAIHQHIFPLCKKYS